ncbi:contact-dependent growth inhibition system immunity protein [Catenulispora subtropica]|uniref:CdiI immunity protein domain-containing protein n=1 Tax=Catenulispora subtropica TaxID=450798 RepID=A0ABN2SPG7_9ACTN
MTQPDIFDDDAPWAERLPELRLLLDAYSSVQRQERFTDTPDSPSKAMRSYLRMAIFYPGRAFRATAEILDTLKRGLDDPEVMSEMASMMPILAPDGRTREDCLRMMIPHLVAFTEAGERAVVGKPETSWEWRERLPNLSTLLGGYYHQDVSYEHPGPDGTLDEEAVLADYFATKSHDEAAATVFEINELLAMGSDEKFLDMATSKLGVEVVPPPGLSHEEWLSAIARDLQQRLDAVDYQPSPPPNPAYPAHDKRAWGGRPTQ